MALSVKNYSKLVGKEDSNYAPYVHSNINNFRWVNSGRLLRTKGKNGRTQLENTKKSLISVRDGLKQQAKDFLGGKSPAQFVEQYYMKNGSKKQKKEHRQIQMLYYQAFTKFFQSNHFYYAMNQKLGYNENDLYNSFSTIFDKESNRMIPLGDAAKTIMDAFTTKAERKKGSKGRIEFTINSGELDKIVDKKLKELFNREKKPSYTRLKKEIKDTLTEYKKTSVNVYHETINILKDKYFEDFVKNIVGENFNEEVFAKYKASFETNLSHYLTEDKIISQQSELSGIIGEEFELAMLSSISEKSIGGFILTGDKNEKQIREILFPLLQKAAKETDREYTEPTDPVQNPWSDESKQSKTDFLMYSPKTGKYARVQAKNYQEIVAKFKLGEQNMLQHIKLFERKNTIPEFIESLQNTGQLFSEIDPEGIAYVLANSLWFAYAGSINKNGQHSPAKIDNSIIFQELGAAVGNFLGIIIDENTLKPIEEFSNTFFWINNEILLPTYVIIDELIKMIDNSNATTLITKFSMTKGTNGAYQFPIDKTAAQFKNEKKEALAKSNERFSYNGDYSDTNLLQVGREMGKNIIGYSNGNNEWIGGASMRNINLDIDYENAIKTAFNLFSKI